MAEEIKIEVNTEALDAAIAKAEMLVDLLQAIHKHLAGLQGTKG